MHAATERAATPHLVVDLDVLERNIAAMADLARRLGVELRPHAKTHKTLEIARRQMAAGATGLSVATLGEAEVFADTGITDLFVAYPLVAHGPQADRLAALAGRTRLRVGVDSPVAAAALGHAAPGLAVLVEVDSGHHRSGVPPTEAGAVAGAARAAGLQVLGVFTFPGHAYGPDMPARAAAGEAAALAEAASSLEAAGHPVTVRSGGSTPTARHTAGEPAVTELRPGVYVFNDAQQVALGSCGTTELGLTARATVVSAPVPGRIVLDAGSKVLGPDRPPWAAGHGLVVELDHAPVVQLSEHHAVVDLPDDVTSPAVGDILHVVPNHCCTAVNLVDELTVVARGEVVDRWRVAARGRNT